MPLSDRIREGRRAKKLSQNDLARRLQTTAMTVSRWERGVAEPSFRFCKAMAEVFGVSLDWLGGVAGEDECPPAEGPLEATGTEG